MKNATVVNSRLRRVLAILLGFVLVSGIYLGRGQELSWAAPGQLPDQQTVPPRPPEPDPPDPNPPNQSLPSEGDDHGDDGHDNSEVPPPAQPPAADDGADENDVPLDQPPEEPKEVVNGDEISPVQPPEQEDDETTTKVLPPTEPDQSEEEADSGSSVSQAADLSLTNRVDNTSPVVDEIITFSVVVHNNGPGVATDVGVSEPLPSGLVLGSVTATRGSYNSNVGEWIIDTIQPSQSLTLTLMVTVTNASVMVNTAEIIAAGQFDPDSTPGNNIASEDDQDSALPVQPLEKEPITSATAPGSLQNSPPIESQNSPTELVASASSPIAVVKLATEFGSLMWLYALGLGLILIAGGIFLTSRS